MSIITLTTDFGLSDYFVAALKGVLLTQVPGVTLVDVTHDLPRHDRVSAAFVIQETFPYFPEHSVHLVVVDPGVGSTRRKIIVCFKGHVFVAPDNGVLSYILAEPECDVFEVTDSKFLSFAESPTFAARDHFSSIAACLARGVAASELGHKIDDPVTLDVLIPKKQGNEYQGRIVYFDHFGNAISNLNRDFLSTALKNPQNIKANISGQTFTGIKKYYAEDNNEEIGFLMNSSGFLEFFCFHGSAKETLNLKLLDELTVTI